MSEEEKEKREIEIMNVIILILLVIMPSIITWKLYNYMSCTYDYKYYPILSRIITSLPFGCIIWATLKNSDLLYRCTDGIYIIGRLINSTIYAIIELFSYIMKITVKVIEILIETIVKIILLVTKYFIPLIDEIYKKLKKKKVAKKKKVKKKVVKKKIVKKKATKQKKVFKSFAEAFAS